MKIQHPDLSGVNSASAKRTGKSSGSAQASKSDSGSNSVKGDKVEISSTSEQFKAIKESLDQIPTVRQSKVDTIKDQVDSGNYHPPAEDIADALINSVHKFS